MAAANVLKTGSGSLRIIWHPFGENSDRGLDFVWPIKLARSRALRCMSVDNTSRENFRRTKTVWMPRVRLEIEKE